VFIEPDAVVVYDRVSTRAGGQNKQVWQLATPVEPVLSGGRAVISGKRTLTVERILPGQGSSSTVVDLAQADDDFTAGFRLETTAPGGGDQRFLHAMWIGNAVTGVTPTADGVTLQVPGSSVTVTFNRDAIGGSLSIDGATTTLGAGVDTLPE
jgi:hypothetical protein